MSETKHTPAIEETAANARLIAAAPDLLAALRAALDAYGDAIHGWTGRPDSDRRQAELRAKTMIRAAIALAGN